MKGIIGRLVTVLVIFSMYLALGYGTVILFPPNYTWWVAIPLGGLVILSTIGLVVFLVIVIITGSKLIWKWILHG